MTLSSLPLSYCTNVHPGQTVAEVVDGLTNHTAQAARQLNQQIAAGLWLSADVIRELMEDRQKLEWLAQTLWQHDLCCYTLNTFPYGNFHSDRVKENVYLPDWTSSQRVQYTEQCASILAELMPPGSVGSMSTVPLGGRMNPHGPDFHAVCYANLIRLARFLKKLHDETGRCIRLGLEPEPLCMMSGTKQWSLPVFKGLFAQAEALQCESLVREYIGVCFDVCHQAVEFEDAAESITLFDRNGIRINKVHITNAVELPDPANNTEGRRALMSYAEPRYLHQTFARFSDGRVESRLDLTTEDLMRNPPDAFLQADAWRVHFHVPVNAETLGPLRTTRPALRAALGAIHQLPYDPHLEVETYTWPVMPGSGSANGTLADRISGELSAALQLIGEVQEPMTEIE